MTGAAAPLDLAQALAAMVVLGVALAALPLAYARAAAVLAGPRDATVRVLLVAFAAAALLRWLVAPHAIATVYLGYAHTGHALELFPVLHYGIGSSAFYHAVFALLPHDHASLIWTNSVLGVLSLPVFAAFAARMAASRRAGAIAALLVALAPIFVRNDNSDANNVPMMAWLWGGLLLWEEHLESGATRPLVAASALCTAAAIARPEAPILVGVLVGLVALARGRAPRWKAAVPLGILGAGMALPHLLHVGAEAAARDGAGIEVSRLRTFAWDWGLLARRTTLVEPRLFPLALLPLGLAPLGLAARQDRRRFVALWGAAVCAVVLYYVDICWANMARVHAPAACLVAILAAAGLDLAWERVARIWRAAIVVAVTSSAVPSALVLFAPTNEQAEEALVRDAVAALPAAQEFTLVRPQWADRDLADPLSANTHFAFPDYLVTPPARPGRSVAIGEFLDHPDWSRPAFFFAGMRCYARFRAEGTPPPAGDNLQPACARMRAELDLKPVVEREVPNQGDRGLPYYGDAPVLRLGLYRLSPSSRTAKPPLARGRGPDG